MALRCTPQCKDPGSEERRGAIRYRQHFCLDDPRTDRGAKKRLCAKKDREKGRGLYAAVTRGNAVGPTERGPVQREALTSKSSRQPAGKKHRLTNHPIPVFFGQGVNVWQRQALCQGRMPYGFFQYTIAWRSLRKYICQVNIPEPAKNGQHGRLWHSAGKKSAINFTF